MEGKNNKGSDSPYKSGPECNIENNRNVPKGLLCRELGHKQKLGAISQEFQAVAEDKLVMKPLEELRCELPGPSRSTFLMVFSPDGTKVASTHGNHNVYVTDLTTGKNVNTLSGHPRTPWCIAFHPSSNQILASGCLGGQVRVWDLHGGSEMWMADGQTVIASLAFHPTDRMLVIATYNELHFWDWSQPEPFTKCYTNNEKEKVRYVAFDPLGHKLITGISNAPQIQSQWDQWDRVSSNSQVPNSSSSSQLRSSLIFPDRERRITVCYRSLVEQYEQLVQRYFDLSRGRSISTMDRGTDPMDFESEESASRDSPGPSSSGINNGSITSSGNTIGRRLEDYIAPETNDGGGSSGTINCNSSNSYLQALFRNPFRRLLEQSLSRIDSATTTDSEPALPANSGSTTTSTTATTSIAGWERHRSESSRWVLPSFRHINSCRVTADRTSHSGSSADSLRRRLSTSALLESNLNRLGATSNRDFRLIHEDGHLPPQVVSSSPDLPSDRPSIRGRPTSPIFLPTRPRRFYVSQSSAFQPRVPRSSEHRTTEHSPDSRNSGRSVLPRRTAQRISLNAATAAAVAAVPERRTPDLDPPRSRSPLTPFSSGRTRTDMTDVGVRYGIQLLSRHIDNMQRLCRARLEILQLQQIRRMWEDLQQQIRSLHSAVRESGVTLTRTSTDSPSRSNIDQTNLTQETPSNFSNQTLEDSREVTENNDSNSCHIPSVSEMLELARISDSTPAGTEASHTPRADSSEANSEEVFQSPVGSSRSNQDSTSSNTPETSAASSGNSNEGVSQTEFMLQQRLWRISRKVYLRRPRLMTVHSRSMKRQLSSGHPPVSRGSSGLPRHSDLPRRPWFLHTLNRHRFAPKPTQSVYSQADPSMRQDGGQPQGSRHLVQNQTSENSKNLDESQPGPSGLNSRLNLSDTQSRISGLEKLDVPVLTVEDVDDDDDDDDDDDELNISVTESPRVEMKRDNEQQCALPPTKMRKIEKSDGSNPQPSTSRTESSTSSEDTRAIRSKLLEEIDRLFPKSPRTSSPGPSSSSSSTSPSSNNPGASTSQSGGSQERSNQQEPSACKSLWSMIARLERLVQQQREHRERIRNVLNSHGLERRSNTWGLRDRNSQRVENSGSDSDSNTESERPRNWGHMTAEERLSNALQTEIYERDRMYRAAVGAQNSRGGQPEEEWEWTRESTRLRARQVLSLMVESLTQFFEENGLSSNTPHDVLDEQIFNLHVLLQLALELTDLLLAQLVCTRRELEHQWVHRLRSPIALSAEDRARENEREREGGSRPRDTNTLRFPPYRRLYRHRLSPEGEGSNCSERLPFRSNRNEFRRSNSRVVNCLARHNRLSPHPLHHHTNLRANRNYFGRPVARPVIARTSAPVHYTSHVIASSQSGRQAEPDTSTGSPASSGNANNEERPRASSNEDNPSSSNIPVSQFHDAFTVPLVRVNDVLIPDTSVLNNQPRTRPQSPPLLHQISPFANPFSQVGLSEQRSRSYPWEYLPYVPANSWRPPRFLHPRYMAPSFNDDAEEPSASPDFSYFRANLVPETVIITDAPMTPNHRIQVWDFSNFHLPDISNAEKNIIVPECKIHNDASVDVSKDGRLLVTLLPSGRQSITTMLGVYSLEWESLGQCLYTTSFLQSAVSVSLSPASRYLLVGLASRRVALLPNDRHYMAQVFRLDGGKPGRTSGRRGRLCHMRDIEHSRDQGYMSLNCIRWAPGSGQGFVYGTNTGQLRVLR